jgi:hypothetical protein
MMKVVLLAAFIGVAFAGQDDDAVAIVKKQALTSSFAERLAARIAAAQVNHGMLKDGINVAATSINRVNQMQGKLEDAQEKVNELKASEPAAVDSQTDELSEKLADAAEALHDELAEKLAVLQKAVKDQKAEADKIVDTGLAAIKTLSDDVAEQIKVAKATQAGQQKCAEEATVFNPDTGKCVVPELSATAYMDSVHHQLWTNSDGRDHGYVNGRELTFTKHYADTYMRIMYYDNVRVHGHTAHGKWEVYICDEGGGGCAPCSNPGRLNHWRWSGHQHGWWMNDHTGGTIFGLCKQTTNRVLGKGAYKLRIYLHENRYWMHSGHHGSHGSFTVDEVMKYD